MGDDRNRILDLLASGKITAEEAGRLLDSLDKSAGKTDGTDAAGASAKTGWPKFFAGSSKSGATGAGATGTGASANTGGAGAAGSGASGASSAAGTGSAGGADERAGGGKGSGSAKFLFVKVKSTKGDNVNVKIPLGVLRAGLKLTTLIPKPATDQINKAMAEKGMAFDLNSLKPEDLQELIDALAEMEIEVDANDGDTVRVYAA